MLAKAPLDPVLERFRAEVNAAYGGRVARLVLFGSRARGEARADSDYDIAVFLHGEMPDRIAELYKLADMSTAILEETGAFIHAAPYLADDYEARLPLMHEVRREGVDL